MSVSHANDAQPPVPASVTTEPVHFCDHALADLRGRDARSGGKMYQYALQMYLSDIGPLLNRISTGVAVADHDQVRRAAHSLKSNSMLIGAIRVGAQAGIIEHHADAKQDIAMNIVDELVRLSERASDEIAKRICNPPMRR